MNNFEIFCNQVYVTDFLSDKKILKKFLVCCDICVEGLRKITKGLSYYRWCPDRRFNLRVPKDEAVVNNRQTGKIAFAYDIFYSLCSYQHFPVAIAAIFRVMLLQQYKVINVVTCVV